MAALVTWGFVAALVGPALVGHALAAPCTRVSEDAPVWLCPSGEAMEAALALTAEPLAVVPSPDDPLLRYAHLVREVSKAAKLSPLIFPGPPRPHPAADAHGPEVLTGGYLYTTDEAQARRWHRTLQLHEVLATPTAAVRRGDEVFVVHRRSYGYFHLDGPMAGRRASILLFDQVAPTEEELPPPAAFDVQPVRRALGIRRFDVRSLTDRRLDLVAHFANGAAIALSAVHTGRQTVFFSTADADALREASAASRLDTDVEHAILDAAREMVAERLRFDEPKTEYGQQDGFLRRAWYPAYRKRKPRYEVNGDLYPTYDKQGRPYVPQVCIDYIVDAIDRSGGSWFTPRGQAPRRTPGYIELRDWPGYRARSVADTVRLAEENPHAFNLYTLPPERRVPWADRRRFREHLDGMADVLRPADVIVIYGLRDDGRNHYHTYFVYETDPLFGIPVAFADNAGWANIRVVDDIMSKAPRRYILHRVRVRPEWIRQRRDGGGYVNSEVEHDDDPGVAITR